MNVTFSGGIRRAGAKPVKEMREHLFEWENHPRFRADDETVLQIESVTAKVHNFVENDVVREEEDESEDTETNEDDEANPTEDGQHNEEDDEENVQMSEDEGGKFLGQQMIDQRFDDVGASGMDMIAMDTEGQPPTPLSDVTTVLETQNDLHLKMPRHKNNSLLFLRDLMRYEVHALKDAEWKKTRISTTRTRTRDRQLENALECMEVGEEHIITKEASVKTNKKIKKKTSMDTNDYLKQILERLNRLELENSELKAKMQASTGPGTSTFSSSPQVFKPLPPFKDGFGSTISSEDGDLEAKMLHLVSCCKQLKNHYNKMSILNKLLAVIPMKIQIQLKPIKENDLDSYLEAIEASFDSELLTLEAQNKLETFKLISNMSYSENLKIFMGEVQSFNYKCSLSLKTKPRSWTNFKATTHFTEKILKPGHLRAKFYHLWNEKMETMDIESWTPLTPRNLLMKAELSSKMLASSSNNEKIMLQASQYSGPRSLPAIRYRTCFSCDERVKLFRSQRMRDGHHCSKKVSCPICSKNHLGKHHEADEAMYNKGPSSSKSSSISSSNAQQYSVFRSKTGQGVNTVMQHSVTDKRGDNVPPPTTDKKDIVGLMKGIPSAPWRGPEIEIFGEKRIALLDIGAHMNAISANYFKKHYKNVGNLEGYECTAQNADGSIIKSYGKISIPIVVSGYVKMIEFKVLDGLQAHPRLFSEFKGGALKVKPLEIILNQDPNSIKGKFSKAKPLSFKEMEIVKNWFNKGLKEGYLEPSQSQFRSSIFPVAKSSTFNKDGSEKKNWRIITPFFNVNKYLNVSGQGLPSLNDIKGALASSKLYSTLDRVL
eukprot:augustus_masked-scaffold_30-processed-gene-3.11-mRNA-1 protein AED:1.00 eAED:1.00 QI:0/0/0/0/1/1/4/0/828